MLYCYLTSAADLNNNDDTISLFISTGLNLGRMLGDKFLKEQDSRFSSEPYVSQAVRMTKACLASALIARYQNSPSMMVMLANVMHYSYIS
jgi:hypothetical protein